MKPSWGPDSIPELQPYPAEERRRIWRSQYGDVLMSRYGLCAVILYAVIVYGFLELSAATGTSVWPGRIAGNLAGMFAGMGVITAEVRRRIAAGPSAAPGVAGEEET